MCGPAASLSLHSLHGGKAFEVRDRAMAANTAVALQPCWQIAARIT